MCSPFRFALRAHASGTLALQSTVLESVPDWSAIVPVAVNTIDQLAFNIFVVGFLGGRREAHVVAVAFGPSTLVADCGPRGDRSSAPAAGRCLVIQFSAIWLDQFIGRRHATNPHRSRNNAG